MVKHIVLWRMKDEAQGRPKAENVRLARQKLEALRGRIPGLLKVEVGVDFGRTDQSADLSLVAELESPEALQRYQDHPAHQEVVTFLRQVRDERRVIDYET